MTCAPATPMPKVLIIDDAPFIADIYRRFLVKQGFTVEVDLDGQDALAQIATSQPDAVLLDIMLKNASGLEILQKIRAKQELQHLPVIILSSATSLSLFRKLKEAGATRLFNKVSSKPAEVVEAIRFACSSKSQVVEVPVAAVP